MVKKNQMSVQERLSVEFRWFDFKLNINRGKGNKVIGIRSTVFSL